jgi:hypothetical protein
MKQQSPPAKGGVVFEYDIFVNDGKFRAVFSAIYLDKSLGEWHNINVFLAL